MLRLPLGRRPQEGPDLGAKGWSDVYRKTVKPPKKLPKAPALPAGVKGHHVGAGRSRAAKECG